MLRPLLSVPHLQCKQLYEMYYTPTTDHPVLHGVVCSRYCKPLSVTCATQCSAWYTRVGSCHVVLCLHAVVCGLASVHRACMVCKDLCQASVLTQLWRTSALCRACPCDRWFSEQEVVYCICTAGMQYPVNTARLWRPHTVTQLQDN